MNGSVSRVRGGFEGRAQQAGKGDFGDGHFVEGDGRSALGHVKHALRRSPVALGVVQDALTIAEAVRADDVRVEMVSVFGQGQLTSHAGAVQNKALAQARQPDRRLQGKSAR